MSDFVEGNLEGEPLAKQAPDAVRFARNVLHCRCRFSSVDRRATRPRERGRRRVKRESRVSGWGGRIRTSVWRNQNPTTSTAKFRHGHTPP